MHCFHCTSPLTQRLYFSLHWPGWCARFKEQWHLGGSEVKPSPDDHVASEKLISLSPFCLFLETGTIVSMMNTSFHLKHIHFCPNQSVLFYVPSQLPVITDDFTGEWSGDMHHNTRNTSLNRKWWKVEPPFKLDFWEFQRVSSQLSFIGG